MNGEKIKPSQYLATCIFLLIGVILFYSGLFLGISFVLIGIGAMLIGWGVAIVALLTVLFQTKAQDKRHASVASIAFIFLNTNRKFTSSVVLIETGIIIEDKKRSQLIQPMFAVAISISLKAL